MSDHEEVPPCELAPIRGRPPTQEEWRSAMREQAKLEIGYGSRTSAPQEIRIDLKIEPDREWLRAYNPKWSPEALVVRPKRTASDSLLISWEEIARLDQRQGNASPAPGIIAGGILGVIAAATATKIHCRDGGELCGFSFYGYLVIFVLGGMAVGGRDCQRTSPLDADLLRRARRRGT